MNIASLIKGIAVIFWIGLFLIIGLVAYRSARKNPLKKVERLSSSHWWRPLCSPHSVPGWFSSTLRNAAWSFLLYPLLVIVQMP